MQEYRRNWTALWSKYMNTEETGRTFVKMHEYRRNWTGVWSKCRNTEETGEHLGQNAGIQKKLDRTLVKIKD